MNFLKPTEAFVPIVKKCRVLFEKISVESVFKIEFCHEGNFTVVFLREKSVY